MTKKEPVPLQGYPDGHSPFCHKSCTDPCHDAYDESVKIQLNQPVALRPQDVPPGPWRELILRGR